VGSEDTTNYDDSDAEAAAAADVHDPAGVGPLASSSWEMSSASWHIGCWWRLRRAARVWNVPLPS
jgi:hypothetical protein